MSRSKKSIQATSNQNHETNQKATKGASANILPTNHGTLALQALMPEIEAMTEEETRVAILSVFETTVLIEGKLPSVEALLPVFESEMKHPPTAELDNIRSVILALREAELNVMASYQPNRDLVALFNDTVMPIRRLLDATTQILTLTNKLDSDQVLSAQAGASFVEESQRVLGTIKILRNSWSQVNDSCSFDLDQLATMEQQVTEFLTNWSNKAAEKKDNQAQVVRQKVLTILLNRWDKIRQAVQFVRYFEGDADSIAPSLFSSRKRSRKASQPIVTPAPAVH